MAALAGVSGGVFDGHGDGVLVFTQRVDDIRRHPDAPTPGGVQHGGDTPASYDNGDNIARRCARDAAADNLRLAMFGAVQCVVGATDVINGDNRRLRIHQQRLRGRRTVPGFIRQGDDNLLRALRHQGRVRRIDRDSPASVGLNLYFIRFAIPAHQAFLARFRIALAL